MRRRFLNICQSSGFFPLSDHKKMPAASFEQIWIPNSYWCLLHWLIDSWDEDVFMKKLTCRQTTDERKSIIAKQLLSEMCSLV